MSFGVTLGLVLILLSLKLLMLATFINHKHHLELAAGAFVAGLLFVIVGVGILAGQLGPSRPGAIWLAGSTTAGLTIGTTIVRLSADPDNPAPANRLAILLAAAALFFLTITVTLYLRS